MQMGSLCFKEIKDLTDYNKSFHFKNCLKKLKVSIAISLQNYKEYPSNGSATNSPYNEWRLCIDYTFDSTQLSHFKFKFKYKTDLKSALFI